ncbi:HMG domain containing protein [Rhodotorula toruloides]|uniref:HMG domain containing protein n=1 Tax=Rhodotorula toruloides TaxID=5286 RepID=A0A511KQW0_RHOTO|nr:HMG domain containing protein [Rhodotorula toruloides]
MQEDDPGLRKSQGELSKIISEMWRGADRALKQHYEELAKQRKLEHQRAYPDYRYSPAKTQGKALKPKRSVSSGSSRTTRPSLRLSPSQLPRRTTYGQSHHYYVQQQTVGGVVGAYDGAGGGDSSSIASSSHGSPAYASLPTPSTAGWTHYGDWSLPASAMSTYEGHDVSALPHYRQSLGEPHSAVPTVHPAVVQPHLMPASAPATITHFSSALGLSMSPHRSVMASYQASQARAAHRSGPPPQQVPSTDSTNSSAYAPPAHCLSPPSSAGLPSSYGEPHEYSNASHPEAMQARPSTAHPQVASNAGYSREPASSSTWALHSYGPTSPPLVAHEADYHGSQPDYQLTLPAARGPNYASLYRSPGHPPYLPASTSPQYQRLLPPPRQSLQDSPYDTVNSHGHSSRTTAYAASTHLAQEYEHVSHEASSSSSSTQQLDHSRQYPQEPRPSISNASHRHAAPNSYIYPQSPPSA